MEDPMKISLTFTDGTEAEFETRTYMSLGDRIAFERRFGVTAATVGAAAERLRAHVDADGQLSADTSPEALGELREEWLLYFVWRAACRAIGPLPEFDVWADALAEWSLEDEGTDAAGPTRSGAPPG
jgi:hypothetical protein